MQQKWGIRGMAVAPHSLASESALAVLREGGNALEAMVAAAATIAVVYPHMNSIGGDSFWVVHSPGKAMGGIDACGAAAGLATKQWYAERGITKAIPFRGPVAANTALAAHYSLARAKVRQAESALNKAQAEAEAEIKRKARADAKEANDFMKQHKVPKKTLTKEERQALALRLKQDIAERQATIDRLFEPA